MLRKCFNSVWLLAISALAVGMIAMPAQAAEQQNIVDTARSAGNFQTFCRALETADLIETMQGEGPFTVFAPTDEAFAKLPPGKLQDLLDDKEKLKGILLFHVIPDKVMAADFAKMSWIRTVGGKRLRIRATDDGVTINRARVTKTDVLCTNGVIHFIDAVLIPE